MNPSRVGEGDGHVGITVTMNLSEPTTTRTPILAQTKDGTATQPADYSYREVGVFPNIGDTSLRVSLTLSVVDDTRIEGNETLQITLSTTDYTVIPATITIIDNDAHATGRPEINGVAWVRRPLYAGLGGIADADGMSKARLEFGETGYDADYAFTYQWIRVNGGTDKDITKNGNFRTYYPVAADVGKTLKVRVDFKDDNGHAESVISGATSAVANPPTDAPTLSISGGQVRESDGTALFDLILSRDVAAAVTVAYATSNGSATAGTDYTATSGTATFPPGEQMVVIEVPVAADGVAEAGSETFTMRLSNPTGGATLGEATATATIIDDSRPPRLRIHDAEARETEGVMRFPVTLSPPR